MKCATFETTFSLLALCFVSFLQSKIATVNGFTVVSPGSRPTSLKSTPRTGSPPSSHLCLFDPSSISFSAEVLQLPSIGTLYESCLDTYPLPTKASTAGLLCGVGDYVAQKRDNSLKTIDGGRLRRFALKGLGSGLIWTAWYDNIDFLSESCLMSIASGLELNGAAQVATSMALEQFLWCPLVFGLWEIPMGALLSGAKPESIPGMVQSKLGGVLVGNAKIWTPANLVVYNIPVEYRVLLSSVVDILWQSILSEVAAECGASQQQPSTETKRNSLLQPQLGVTDPGVAMVSNFLQTGAVSSQVESSSKQRRRTRSAPPVGTQAALEMNQ